MSAPNPVCVEGFPGMPAEHHAGQPKIRMVEDVEELRFEPQLHALGQRKPFRQVEVAPEEIRPAQRVAAEVAELAILRRVAAGAGARARIDGRDEGIGIEPLNRARLRHAGNGIVS